MSNEEIIVREEASPINVTTGSSDGATTVVSEPRSVDVEQRQIDAVEVSVSQELVTIAQQTLDRVVVETAETPLEVRGPDDGPQTVEVAERERVVEVRGPGPTVPPIAPIQKWNVSLSGLQNGTNKTYTTPDVFVASALRVYVNGLRLLPGAPNGYTVTGASTVLLEFALITQDCIWADYVVGP